LNSYRPLPGTPVEELDTPCLLLDMEALEHNISLMAGYYADRPTKLRPHTKNHKSPIIAQMQLRAGGTAGGVCTAKVSEAEVMVQGGIPQVLVANQVVARDKIARLTALASQADIMVACDDPRNALDLSHTAHAAGVQIGVLIEVDTQMGRCGVRTLDQGLRLAREITSLPRLRFRGIMSHQNIGPTLDRETRVLEGQRIIQKVLDFKQLLERDGLPVEIVSTGETWTYDVAGDIPGVTEVQGGTYLLMEKNYSYMSEFKFAAKVLGTVVSANRPGMAVGDVGVKAIASPKGMPIVDGMEGVTVEALHAEHTILKFKDRIPLKPGDKFALIPGQQDIMVNRWDQFIAVRHGKVEAVWDIAARGCHH
jgi:D-serine deaminase-like pyridoxal phosphate-dependent protein